MKTAVDSRDVIGWVVAKEIGHWNLPSTSEIDGNSNTCPVSLDSVGADGWRNISITLKSPSMSARDCSRQLTFDPKRMDNALPQSQLSQEDL
jgi:hypothetical protein